MTTNYVKYIGTQVPHAVGVTAPGDDPDNPLDGATTQTVYAGALGVVVTLDPGVAAALLAKEPTLWEAVSGLGG